MLDSLASALGVSRSVAISHLISVHAGRETERARDATQPFPVVRWSQPKLAGPHAGELIGYIAGLVRAGCPPVVAASMAGVTSRQLGVWRRRGRQDLTNGEQSLYADFEANLESAQAEGEAEDLATIKRAGAGDWRAVAWRLSRLYPDRYGERKRVDRTNQVNMVPVIDWDRYTVTQARTLVELLRIGSPDLDDPRITKTARPALELLPPDVAEAIGEAPPVGETIDGEAREAPPIGEESPGAREAPALGDLAGDDPASEQTFGGTDVRANTGSENVRSGERVFASEPDDDDPPAAAELEPDARDPSD